MNVLSMIVNLLESASSLLANLTRLLETVMGFSESLTAGKAAA